jgi:ankyrin repeat protein
MGIDPFAAARDGDVGYIVKLVAEEGYNINTVRWSGFTLLHRAAECGHTQLCEYLVQQGAKLDLKTTWGWFTPVHLALGNGWKETAAYLVEAGAKPTCKNKDGQTPAEYAHVRGYRDLSRDFSSIIQSIQEAQKAATEHRRMKEMAKLRQDKNAKMEAMRKKVAPKVVVPVERTISAIDESV